MAFHDPQGTAVQQSLHTLGFETVQEVRMGKFLEVDLQDTEKGAAASQIEKMCQQLLAEHSY